MLLLPAHSLQLTLNGLEGPLLASWAAQSEGDVGQMTPVDTVRVLESVFNSGQFNCVSWNSRICRWRVLGTGLGRYTPLLLPHPFECTGGSMMMIVLLRMCSCLDLHTDSACLFVFPRLVIGSCFSPVVVCVRECFRMNELLSPTTIASLPILFSHP